MDHNNIDRYPEFEPLSVFGPMPVPGVYGVFEYDKNGNAILLYVGSSHNIKKRVLRTEHHYMKLYSQGRNVCTRIIETNSFEDIEKEIIRKYKPELNIIYYG